MKAYKNWLKQAEADYDVAEYNLNGKFYYACANYAQQAVEKALKALLIKDKEKLIKTHSITKPAKLLEAPKKTILKVASLEPVQRLARYPGTSDKIPCEEYEEKDAIEFINIA